MLISKIDTILKPFLNLHFKHSFFKYLSKVFKTISIPFNETKNQENGFLRFTHQLFIILLGVILCVIASPLYLLIYVITAFITFFVSSFVVLGVGLFYGLFPFLLNETNNQYKRQTSKSSYSGYNKLLEPISWSGVVFNYTGLYLFNLGIRPINQIKELNKCDYQTHILDRISFALASVISFILYSIIFCGIIEILANFFIFVIVAVSVTLWMIIYIFDTLIKTLFSNKED